MARFSRFQRKRSPSRTLVLFLLRTALFLLLVLVFFYVVRKQEQRFSEVRLPTGKLP